MKHTIDFNEHLDAQARAYEIGKAEGIELANAPKVCCGKFNQCSAPCGPRADFWEKTANDMVKIYVDLLAETKN